MPRNRRQPRQGKSRRKRPGLILGPTLQAAQPRVQARIPYDLTQASTPPFFTTVDIGGTNILTMARFTTLATTFWEVRFIRIMAFPVNLSAAQYLEYAFLPAHNPALLSTFDGVSSVTVDRSILMTLPGARRCYQASNTPPVARLSLPNARMFYSCDTVVNDSPPLGFFQIYSSAATATFNVFLDVEFRGYRQTQ